MIAAGASRDADDAVASLSAADAADVLFLIVVHAVVVHEAVVQVWSVVQSQKAVTAYFSIKQLTPFCFADHR